MRSSARTVAKERVGTRIDGKWHLDELIGFGGCAAVYSATHRNGARAAVKILHRECLNDEILRTRFVREGHVANKVSHPGVVAVLDDDEMEDGVPYLVMELLAGRSHERPRTGEGSMPVSEVVRVADEVLDVLAKAHAAGIVHRDLKPANIFLTKNDQVKLLDFGIARLAEAAVDPDMTGTTQTGMLMGTASYMSPEQARGRWHEVDGRADLWALGATMLTLILGRRPRIAETSNEELLVAMTTPMAPALSIIPSLPPALAVVIDRALAFKRDDRWPDATAMQAALRAAVTSPLAVAAAPTALARHVKTHVIAGPQPAGILGVPRPPPSVPVRSAPSSSSSITTAAVFSQVPTHSPVTSPSFPPRDPVSTASSAASRWHPVPSPGSSRVGAAAFVIIAVILGLIGLTGVGLYLRAKPHSSALSAAPPPAVVEATPGVASAEVAVPPVDHTTEPEAVPMPSTSERPPARIEAAPPPSVAPPVTRRPPGARPTGSSNPQKYFDDRF